MNASLPEPDDAAREHSHRLSDLLRGRVATRPMPFVDWMQAALYEPGLGYYMAGARKFGHGGDFITAPEVSPLYAGALAAQCRQVFDAERGVPRHVLELGSGSGALALGLLEALPADELSHYAILELSPELQARQRITLVDALGESVLQRVSWLDALPERFDGVVIANEVVDALPVERFVKRGPAPGDAWRVATTVGQGRFVDVQAELPESLRVELARRETGLAEPLPGGYASELNALAAPWLASLAAMLGRAVVLIIDYGYPRAELYSAERTRGTLACYYRHRAHDDPYRWPGLQDITAHVDFTALAEAGTGAGLSLLGYTAQAGFLLGNRLTELAEARMVHCVRETERIAIAQQVKTLTLPGEMGERFQVIAFGSDYDRALQGFAGHDLTHRL